jgi:hypothetical protein
MKSLLSRGAVAIVTVSGAILVATVQVTPQAQAPQTGPQAAQPAPPGGVQGQPGRGGRGGLGGPQENDPANATADYGAKPPTPVLTPEEEAKKIQRLRLYEVGEQ